MLIFLRIWLNSTLNNNKLSFESNKYPKPILCSSLLSKMRQAQMLILIEPTFVTNLMREA